MSSKQRCPIKVHKSVRSVVETALRNGWTVERTKNNHLKFSHPVGATVFHSGTPSDHRANKNVEAKMRREVRRLKGESK